MPDMIKQETINETLRRNVAVLAKHTDDEKRMIGEILDLDELTVRDVMQPRVDIIAVEDCETVRTALE